MLVLDNIIKLMREEKGLSQSALADAAKLDSGYINQLESGKRNFRGIAAETAVRIAQALDTTVEYIVGNTPEKPLKVKRAHDLTGKRFGKWTVLRRDPEIKKRYYWVCRCDCGNIMSVAETSLTAGRSTSCGCSKRSK